MVEAESAAAVKEAITQWRARGPGFFKCTKTAAAMSVQEPIALSGEIVKAVGAA